jgi:hypothetical protein
VRGAERNAAPDRAGPVPLTEILHTLAARQVSFAFGEKSEGR